MSETAYVVDTVKYSNTFEARSDHKVKHPKLLLEARPTALSYINYIQQKLSDRLRGQKADDVNILLEEGVETLRTDLKRYFEGLDISVVPSDSRTTDPAMESTTAGRFITLRVLLASTLLDVKENFEMKFDVTLKELNLTAKGRLPGLLARDIRFKYKVVKEAVDAFPEDGSIDCLNALKEVAGGLESVYYGAIDNYKIKNTTLSKLPENIRLLLNTPPEPEYG
jgi:hypothetical protein